MSVFIDIHTHGGGGFDFNTADEAGIERILDYYAAEDVGSAIATVMTDDGEIMLRQLRRIAAVARVQSGILGVHLEGPFLSKMRRGVMQEQFLRGVDLRFFEACQEAAGGLLRMVTIAPELSGAAEFVRDVTRQGIIVSLGHSDCTYAQAMECVDAGAKCFTHLFNGMRSLHHREPGIVGAALMSDCFVELICDGFHLAPETVRLITKIKDISKLILVTDSTAAAGMCDGAYMLGGQKIEVSGGKVVLGGSDVLAGSALTAANAVRNFAAYAGVPISVAENCMNKNPRELLGLG